MISPIRTVAILLACASTLTHAQDAGTPDPGRFSARPAAGAKQIDPAIVAKAQAMLDKAAETFAKAPALTCTTNVEINAGESVRTLLSESAFGPDGTMRVETDASLVVVKDGHLHLVAYAIPDRYLHIPVQLGVADEFESHYRHKSMAGWEILMREQDGWLDAITLRAVGTHTIVGLEEGLDRDGTIINRVHLHGFTGAGHLDIDAETNLIDKVHVTLHPQPGFEGFAWVAELDIDARIHDALPSPIVFDPGPRSPAPSPKAMDPVGRNEQSQGNTAPALALSTLDGTHVDLAALKGEVVVLDFVATWCEPSKRSMTNINQLYLDLGRNEGDVKVYAVACWEKEELAEDKLATVRAYQEAGEYEVPILVAPDEMTRRAWGINNTPMLAVIGRDGRIAKLIIGWKHDEVKQTAHAIKQALSKPADE